MATPPLEQSFKITTHDEDTTKTCINVPKNPSPVPTSYFLRIKIGQRKIRFEVPQLLAKALQKKSSNISSMSGCRRNNVNNSNVGRNVSKFGSVFPSVLSKRTRGHGPLVRRDVGVVKVRNEDIQEENERPRKSLEKRRGSSSLTLSLTGLFRGRTKLNFVTTNIDRRGGTSMESGEGRNNVSKTSRRKLKIADIVRRMMRRKIQGKFGDQHRECGEGRGDEELCKKRILMGGKCRPISSSGTLEYDENGILLPDVV